MENNNISLHRDLLTCHYIEDNSYHYTTLLTSCSSDHHNSAAAIAAVASSRTADFSICQQRLNIVCIQLYIYIYIYIYNYIYIILYILYSNSVDKLKGQPS